MRRSIAISAACLLLFVSLTMAGHAEDRALPASAHCALTAFPQPPRPVQTLDRWEQLRSRVLRWFVSSEEPAAALARLGGTRVLMRADADIFAAAILGSLRDDARCLMRAARIPYGGLAVHDGSVELRLRDVADLPRAVATLAATASVPGQGRAVDVVDIGDGLIKLTPTEAARAWRLRGSLDRTAEIIRQRLKDLGIDTADVRRDGADRILVLLPGAKDPARLVGMLGSRARLEFRLIDPSMTAEDALKSGPPLGSEVLYGFKTREPYLVSKRSAMSGEDIVDATPSLPQGSNKPIVAFRFDARGTRDLAQVTRENIGRPFAIVLDDAVVSAPVIREPILGGSGQISGNFTLEQANDLAILMRAGMLPVSLTVVEQQTVAPAPK